MDNWNIPQDIGCRGYEITSWYDAGRVYRLSDDDDDDDSEPMDISYGDDDVSTF